MAQEAINETSAPKEPVAASGGSEDRTQSTGSSNQHSDAGMAGFETVQVLKEWPIVTSAVDKAHEFYNSLKTSCGVLNWSCSLVEKTVRALSERSSNILTTLYPALRIADLAASEIAEAVQNKLPVVRQPPSQVSDAIRSGLSDLFAPLVDRIEATVNIGKRRTRNGAKNVVEMCRKLVHSLDKWVEDVEKYVNSSKSKGTQVPQVQQQTSVTEPAQMNARTLARRALDAASNVALFYVGASFWVLSRLPVIGKFLDQSPAPSKSTSPVRQVEVQSSHSASESLPSTDTAEPVVEQRQSNGSREVSSNEEHPEK